MRTPADSAPTRRAVILTAIPVEYAAVRALLRDPVEVIHPTGTVYEVGTIGQGVKMWSVAIAEIGAGNETTALEAERAIEHFKATHVLFVGVAGGLKDVALGDVVAGTKVYGYESGKAASEFETRPDVGESSHDLVQRARAVARGSEWAPASATGPRLERKPQAFVGALAAGSKVVANRRSETARLIRKHYGDALAVEMEGRGLLRAAHARSGVGALVVRGISDLVNNKAKSDAAGWQEAAAQHAAAFAIAVLTALPGSGDSQPAEQSDAVALKAVASVRAAAPAGPPEAGGSGDRAGVTSRGTAADVQPSSDVRESLRSLLTTLYPSGPRERDVWERAGGDLAALEPGISGQSAWFRALRLAGLGGGGATLERLIDIALGDYPENAGLRRIKPSP